LKQLYGFLGHLVAHSKSVDIQSYMISQKSRQKIQI